MKKKIISLALASIVCFTAVMGDYMISNAVEESNGLETDTTGDQYIDTDGLNISKYVTYTYTEGEDGATGDYTYELLLESFTTGEVSQESDETVPTDIVLVLDQSTSMLWPTSGSTGATNKGIIDGFYVTDEDGNYIFSNDGNLIWVTWVISAEGMSTTADLDYYYYNTADDDRGDYTVPTSISSIGSTIYKDGDGNYYQLVDSISTGGYQYSKSRQKLLIDSVAAFIYSLDTTAGHQVSIVTYNSSATVYDFEVANTADSEGNYDYTNIINTVVGWYGASNGEKNGNNDYVDSSNNVITASGKYTFNLEDSTLTALGVEAAEEILSKSGNNADICVIFTDGEPTNIEATGDVTSSDDAEVEHNVSRSLSSADDMKESGVTVFTVGLISGITESDSYSVTSSTDTSSSNYISAFLDYMSSNYLGATSITGSYTKDTALGDDSYYYPISSQDAATVASNLSDIFETVEGSLTSATSYNLDSNTQIRDVMTSDFTIPEDATGVTVSIMYATGTSEIEGITDTNDSDYYTWSDAYTIYEDTSAVGLWSGSSDDDDGITVVMNYVNENGTVVDSDHYEGTTYQQVVVEGFDYNAYYVLVDDSRTVDEDIIIYDETNKVFKKYTNADDFYGAKIVISFEIESDSLALDVSDDGTGIDDEGYFTVGGNAIDTNMDISGIYLYNSSNVDEDTGNDGYSSVASFPVPTADIPIELNFSVTDQTIYLGNSISVADLLQIDGHSIMGEANKYVNITFSIYSDIDGNGEVDTETADPLLNVYIPAGESMSSAVEGLYDAYSLITPSTTSEYVVTIHIDPIYDGSVGAYYDETQEFSVYVLNPTILANDTWVDYATPVNLREDNIIQAITDDTEAFDAVRVSWETTESYGEEIPEPNEDIPPTVTFGFTARRGIEYTAAEFEEYGIREDKEFEITSMTVVSSDGYNNTTVFDLDAYEEAYLTTFSVNINRFDLVISKTVEADVYDSYPQSFIFDVEYTGSEFVTEETIYTDAYGFAIFSRESNSSSVVKLYVDMTDYDVYEQNGSYTIYSNVAPDDTYEKDEDTGYYDITSLFATVSGNDVIMNDSDSADWIDTSTFTIHYGSAPTTDTTPEDTTDDGFVSTTVNKVAAINDIIKNIEVVIDPDMSNVSQETIDIGGVEYYTFSTTITDLYCGIEMTVTEETDWSWRYEPTFSVETIDTTYDDSSTGETVTTTTGSEGTTQVTTTTIEGYKIADFDEIHSGDVTLGAVTDADIDYDYYLTTYTFDSVSTVTINADADTATILVSNSGDYLDKGDDESYSDWTRITELTYFGSELYTAELVSFSSENDTITYKSTAPTTLDQEITLSNIYYYDDSGTQVYSVLEDADDSTQLAENTYYTTVDGVESIAFSIVEIPETVAAVYFDTLDVELDVSNSLEENKDTWLSDSSLIENLFDLYSSSDSAEKLTND